MTAFGEVFASIGCREPQPQASEVFSTFGEAHRSIEKYAITMLKTVKPVGDSVALGSISATFGLCDDIFYLYITIGIRMVSS